MTRSIRGARRGAVLLAAAVTTTLLVAGCGTGQIAETANARPGIPGVSTGSTDGLIKVRNLVVEYPNPAGYPAGGNAPLSMAVYNDSDRPVTVEVSTDSAGSVLLVDPRATPTGTPVGEESPGPADPAGSPDPAGTTDPAGSPDPAGTIDPAPSGAPEAPAGGPARIEIPAYGFVVLSRSNGRYLQLVNLNSALLPGHSTNLIFDFNGERVETPIPVAIPMQPGPRGSAQGEEAGGGHG